MKSHWYAIMGSLLILSSAHAASPVASLKWPQADIKESKIEASGIVWDAKRQHFLIVSDEEYKNQPGVVVLTQDGNLAGILNMQPNTVINDLESISTDGDFIYILNSFNVKELSKVDALGTGKLIRFKYQGTQVTEQQEINLESLLSQMVKSNARLAALLGNKLDNTTIDAVNIEAHLVLGNDLYLGLHSPQENKHVVFVKVTDINSLFNGQTTSAQIVLTMPLPSPKTGKATQLSDMALVGTDLFLLSSEKGSEPDSYLWRYSLTSQKLTLAQTFGGLQAEGITYYPTAGIFVVVFDEGGEKASKYQLFSANEL